MDYDYIIVGSGGAGLYAALKAQEHGRVLILTKGALGEGSTPLAQGGIAAAIGPQDSDELHLKDTLRAGRGLCNLEAVSVLVSEAASCIEDLIHLGVPFDYDGEQIAFGLEGAHSVARVLHAGGDATGLMLQRVLEREIAHMDRITVRGKHLVTEIAVIDGVCQGVRALDLQTGQINDFAGRFVVLATGGFGQLFAHTTNAEGATWDGTAVAFEAGADIADMEFVQFHPTVLRTPTEHHFLISEAVRGEGAILRDLHERAFMKAYDPRAELAPRDVVTRAILNEMEQANHPCVYLDITHLPEERIKERFPSIYKHCLEHGIDMAHTFIPVAPAAHYSIGGVKTDLWGETNIPNLFACGEAASTGVHGANRLASNSLLELLVFGRRVVRRTIDPSLHEATPERTWRRSNDLPDMVIEMESIRPTRTGRNVADLQKIRNFSWAELGVVRRKDNLEEALKTFDRWASLLGQPKTVADYEFANLILMGRLVSQAALKRCESRGTHYRVDYPEESPNWQRHIVLRTKNRRELGC
jgi:L-aspartate oxidase